MIGGPIYAIWYTDGAHSCAIHYPPPWNHPPPLKYAVGDRVMTSFGVGGTISDILPAPSTSAMRCREHHYYLAVPGRDQLLVAESELSLVPIPNPIESAHEPT